MDRATTLYLDNLKREVAASTIASLRPSGHARLIFALDATASRQPTWDQACHVQGAMFEAVAGLGGLSVQLLFYRGYSECQVGKRLTTAAELHRIMRRVHCAGGQTQIARVFEYAIREAEKYKIGALVFVGDAMEENPDCLCRLAGKLGQLGTPLFILHEGGDADARAWFKQLAHVAKGAYLPFDLSSIAQLKALLGGIATYAAGGHSALAAYGRKHPGEVRRLTAQLTRP